MHSEYLDENKICEFFEEQQQEPPKRDNQVSLNLTVTSRQTGNPASLNSSIINSGNGIGLAAKELDRFNSWIQNFHSKSDKLMDDMSTLTDNLESQQKSNILLQMVDFDILIKKCKNPKMNSNCKRIDPDDCSQCKKNKELIQIINEEYEIKIEQCNLLKRKFQNFEKSFEVDLHQELREKIGREVQNNLLRLQNAQMQSQVLQLKNQIDRNKLLLSVQKSNSLLKTKVDLQRSANSGYIPQGNLTSNSNLRSSFSNMKNLTNLTNPNDTINRIDSIINFENNQPNFDELIRYFEEEASFMKSKAINLVNEEKKISKRIDGLEKKRSISEYPQKKLYKCYSEISKYLIEVKNEKDRYGDRLSSSSNFNLQRLNQKSRNNLSKLEISGNTSNLEGTSTTIITSAEYRQMKNTIKCYESQINNLRDTNQDLVCQLRQCEMKIKKIEHQWKFLCQRSMRDYKQRKRVIHALEETKGKIRIYCRIRPKMKHQQKYKCPITYNYKKIVIEGNKQYQFDQVFGDRASQQQIFLQAKTALYSGIQGKNVCIFTYGQNGSGKSYTLHGNEQHPGLFPNLAQQLFDIVQKQKKYLDISVKMNVLEVEKQNIQDLIKNFDDTSSGKVDLKEDKNGIHLINSVIVKVSTASELLQTYYQALNRRYNNNMSYSQNCHSVIMISLTIMNKKTKEQRHSKISLIELASAQRVHVSNQSAVRETQLANKSLTNLLGILGSLNMSQENGYHRESKLTHLLKDSLNLNSKILMFINVSPSEFNIHETLNSLKFGQRARGIEKLVPKKKQKKQEYNENSMSPFILPRRSSSRLSVS